MVRLGRLVLGIIALVSMAGTGQAVAQERGREPAAVLSPRDRLRAVKSWAYQLQNIDVGRLARVPADLLVVDTDLAKADVQRLKRQPDGSPRIVLAYVNIGEAEEYRRYWSKAWKTKPPEWLGSSNERWQGDHRVRHWHPGWQEIMFANPGSVFARLLANGFDGAYLDRVDIWQFWCGERPSSFEDMVSFVAAMSGWAKRQRPGFMIVPQNGEELLANPSYRSAIDGIGKEDFLFGDRGNDVMNYDSRIELEVELFGHAHKDRIPVFAIEYARDPRNHDIARKRHAEMGHVLYFGPRSLAYIGQAGPLHKEDGDSEPYLATRGRRNCTE